MSLAVKQHALRLGAGLFAGMGMLPAGYTDKLPSLFVGYAAASFVDDVMGWR